MAVAGSGAMIGLAAGWAATLLVPEQFVSTASIRIVPQSIAERFVPAAPGLNAGRIATQVRQTVFSRNTLANIIQTHGLYGPERQRMPMGDVIETVRTTAKLESADDELLRIGFTYRDRLLAQKTVQDIATRQ